MRRAAIVAGAAGLLVLSAAGGFYAIALHQGQEAVARAAGQIREALGPNGSLSFQSPEIHPFSRSASFAHVVLKQADGSVVTADRLSVAPGGGNRLRDLHATGVTIGNEAGTLTAAALDADSIGYPATGQSPPDPAALMVDTATLRDARFAGSGQDTRFARLRIDHYGLGRSSDVDASKVSFIASTPAPLGPITAETLHVAGLDLAALVDAAEHHRQPSSPAGTLAASVGDVAVEKNGATVLTVKRAELNGETGWAQDGRSRLVITGATSTPADPQGIATLKSLGLDAVRWGLVVQTEAKPSVGRASLSDFTLTAQQLGTVAVGMDFSHLDMAALKQAAAAGQNGFADLLGTVQLDALRVRLVDAGMLEGVFAARGRPINMSADQMRQMVLGLVRTDNAFQFLLPQPAMRDAIAHFIEKGGTLSLSAAPNPPRTIAQLGVLLQTLRVDPDGVTRQLGLAASWQAGSATSL